jgi:CRISPR-associated protein Cmr6
LVDALKTIAGTNLASKPYRLAFRRWRALWNGRDDVVCVPGTVRGRLVTGLGAESVLENGLRLHFTYGTPVIPGSTLKGVLRKAIPEAHRDAEKQDGRNYEWYLFGDQDHEGAAQIQDAWWMPEGTGRPLTLDVLTPHHSDYMQRKGPPTDFDEPVPVHFLTVAAKQKFLFVIEAPTVTWKKYMHALLKEALRREGVGAKRSAGYGVVEVD